MVRKIVIVTPRTHPNLRYLINHLQSNDWEVALLVQRITPDFMTGNETILLIDSCNVAEIVAFNPQVILWRFFPRRLTKPVRRDLKYCLHLTYDQKPVGERPFTRILQTAQFVKRLVLRRPLIRVSPAIDSQKQQNSLSNWTDFYFKHPGPKIERLSRQKDLGSQIPVISIVAKQFNRRKRVLQTLKALEQTQEAIRVKLIRSSSTHAGRKSAGLGEIRYERKIGEFLERTSLNVEIAYDLSQKEVLGELEKSDLFILLSARENFSITNFEAASVGTLSLISRDNGALFAMPEGTVTHAHYWLPSRSISKIIQRILRVIEQQPNVRQKIISAYDRWQTGPSSLDYVLKKLIERYL